MISTLLDFLFPQFCESCGDKNISFLCKNCFSSIKFFEPIFTCNRCLVEVDEENSLCINCKRGFFHAKSVKVIFPSSYFSISNISENKLETILSFLILFFDLHMKDQIYDSIYTFAKKDSLIHKIKEKLVKSWNILPKNKIIGGHVLVIEAYLDSKEVINEKSKKLLIQGYDEVSFLYLFKAESKTITS